VYVPAAADPPAVTTQIVMLRSEPWCESQMVDGLVSMHEDMWGPVLVKWLDRDAVIDTDWIRRRLLNPIQAEGT